MTRLAPESRVGVIVDGATVYVAQLPDGPIAVLDAVAAVIWTEACAGDRETVATRVMAVLESATEDTAREIDVFVDTLIERGLLRVLPD